MNLGVFPGIVRVAGGRAPGSDASYIIIQHTMRRRFRSHSLAAIHLITMGVVLATIGGAQQGPEPAPRSFEVASVKANNSEGRGSFEISPAGDRLTIKNTFLGVMIMRAYNVDEMMFTTPTPPLLRERFDLDAKAAHPVSRADLMLMLQTLLVERFNLKFHRETRQVSGYGLTIAKGGPKLRLRTDDPAADCKHRMGTDGQIIFESCPMSDLVGANVLFGIVGRRFVANETDLTGNYDFELMASWEVPANPQEGRPEPRVINSGAPSIFTAVERQLGLKLEPKRISIDFFTVDQIARPSGN